MDTFLFWIKPSWESSAAGVPCRTATRSPDFASTACEFAHFLEPCALFPVYRLTKELEKMLGAKLAW